MTPGAVATALQNANLGRMHRLVDLCSEQREKVTHLAATMAVRERAIAACPWTITPRDQNERVRDT